MLCSEEELGIGDRRFGDHDPPVRSALGAGTGGCPRSVGCGSRYRCDPEPVRLPLHVGVAREWAAIAGKKLRYPASDVIENDEDIQEITSVSILDPDLCPRYTARIIKNVRIGPSPFWIRQRLEAVGLRPINNIVDVTNFVMMELGQPLHAFDFRFLEEGRIVVRRSRAGERFVSLDGKERTLRADTLMICDGVKPVAIGGVMGGLNSEIKEDTETILLESAYFNPASIRRTSRELGHGDRRRLPFRAGDRSGGGDPGAEPGSAPHGGAFRGDCLQGGDRSVSAEDPDGEEGSLCGSVGSSDILGIAVPAEEIVRILENLEMTVEPAEKGRIVVTPRPAASISPGKSILSRRSSGCTDMTGCRRPFPPYR